MNLKRIAACALVCSVILGAAPVLSVSVPEVFITASAASASDEFIAGGMNASSAKTYSHSSEDGTFNMNGRTYMQGVVFTGKNSYGTNTAEISYNTENINKISCTWGHVDNSVMTDATVSVYLDDVLTEKIPLTATMAALEHTFDVSSASVIRISLEIEKNAKYAMAEAVVDGGEPSEIHLTPKYSSAEEFNDSGFNTVSAEPFLAVNQLDAQRVNGRYFYQGITFSGRYTYQNSIEEITFNTENVNSISCAWGHVDNTKMTPATVSVYHDDVLTDKFSLSATMPLTEYTFDVSDTSNLRICVDIEYDAKYSMLDISVDSSAPKKTCTSPEYSTAELFISDGFNMKNTKIHDVISSLETCKVNGRDYYQGIVFGGATTYSTTTAEVTYNTENIDTISCTWGHIDNTKMTNAVVSVYIDNILADKITLSPYMLPMEYTADVSKASTICFSVDIDEDAKYIMGDVKADASSAKRPVVIPDYADSKEFSNSGFNMKNVSVLDAVSDLDAVKINGNTYRQGILFKGATTYSTTESDITFNVENTNTVSFSWGHIDETAMTDAEASVYLDDKLIEKTALTSGMLLKEQIYDVSEASALRVSVSVNKNAEYAMVDVEISDEKVPEPENLWGDIDLNGTVDSSDASAALIEYAAISTGHDTTLTAEQAAVSDVNNDGAVDSSDASLILQFYAQVSTGGEITDMKVWMENR